MKIALFGGTGKTGQHFIEAALEHGHSIQALARSPEKISIEHSRLELIPGDARDAAAVDRVVRGTELVVSFLGVSPSAGELVFTRSLETIFSAMREHSVQRIILTAGAGVGDPNDKSSVLGSIFSGIIKLVARSAYEDGIQAAELVRSQTDLYWTMVRVPRLTDAPGQDSIEAIRIGYLGRGTGFQLSRRDLAAFVLQYMDSDQLQQQAPVISN